MKQTILKLLILLTFGYTAHAQDGESYLLFSIDQCMADISGTNRDFSEFISTSSGCPTLSVVGNNLYRMMPEVNSHSCTPGVNQSVAMCVGADTSCEYSANNDKAIRFDIQVNPNSAGVGQLSNLSFYQKSPLYFAWVNGRSGLNNPPRHFGLSVLVNGEVIYNEPEINATTNWSLQEFDFSANPAFQVTSPTVFSFQITPYCPFNSGGEISIWDIDEIRIGGSSNTAATGGNISGGPFTFCVGDGLADNIPSNGVTLSGSVGQSSQWVVTDATGMTILGLASNPSDFDFDNAGAGTCLLWHLSYNGGLTGATVNAPVAGLAGCFSLSNSISINRIVDGEACQDVCNVNGGMISGGPFTFCAGDNVVDNIPANAITLSENSGSNSQWVVTDATGSTIIGLPQTPQDVNFDTAGGGTCLLWHISFDGALEEAIVNGAVSAIRGCYAISNSITINRNQPEGGTLSGGPFSFCAGDGVADNLGMNDITLSGHSGANSQWVVTDTSGSIILGLPESPVAVNFEEVGLGTCLIWHISYDGQLTGAEIDGPVSALSGCFSLSTNSVTVIRSEPDGGTITGGPYVFCNGDGLPDNIPLGNTNVIGSVGANSQWVVTDADSAVILGLPASPDQVDFEQTDLDTCLLWNLSYNGAISGLAQDAQISSISGCFSLSNAIQVIRTDDASVCDAACDVDGGLITGGPFTFCIGDGIADTLAADAITLTMASGTNSQWVVTSADSSTILGLPSSPSEVNFDVIDAGTCLLWHLSYDGVLTGATVDALVSDLDGCLSLSNAIRIERSRPEAGIISGGPFPFCVGDGESDMIPNGGVLISGDSAKNFRWLLTTADSTIIAIPQNPQQVDFDQMEVGTCLLWYLAFDGNISGISVGNLLFRIGGCYDLSNPITITRSDSGDVCEPVCEANGGRILGGPFTFCTGDGILDTIPTGEVTVSGAIGENTQWIVTNADSTVILDTPDTPNDVNFDIAGEGTCYLWLASFDGALTGVAVDSLFSDIDGCYSLSNSIRIDRSEPNGGMISGGPFTFCVGDSIPDNIADDLITLEGNSGEFSQWLVTTADSMTILGNSTSISQVNFDGADPGICLIWHVSSSEVLSGIALNGPVSNIQGCFSLSNALTVTRTESAEVCDAACDVNGGTLMGGPFNFCLGDSISNMIGAADFTLANEMGPNSQWIITDVDTNVILGLPSSPTVVDFEESGTGTCLLWHVSYAGELDGVEVDSLFSNVDGCLSVSNAIIINRFQPNGGTLSGGPFEICIGDGIADYITDITLVGNEGQTSNWIVTNADSTVIVSLTDRIDSLNFDGSGEGISHIWNISYAEDISGLGPGLQFDAIAGCFSLSNSIELVKSDSGTVCEAVCNADGGTITGGPFSFCVDGVRDTIPADSISLTGAIGNSQWIVTDADSTTILGLPSSPSAVDFDESGPGICLLWHLSSEDTLIGVGVDSLVANIQGCYNLSNAIEIIRSQPAGGTISGGPFEFCIGDGIPDRVFNNQVELSDNVGSNSHWVFTTADSMTILRLLNAPRNVNFENIGIGTYLLWHLSYDGVLIGAEQDSLVSNLDGCFSLSNPLEVVATDDAMVCQTACTALGGTITGGTYAFCVGDGIQDTIPAGDISITGTTGNTQWVVTNADSTIILGLPNSPSDVNFDIAGNGTCLLWNLSSLGTLVGLEEDSLISNIQGCYSLSNAIEIVRSEPDGGMISGGPFSFCVGDGEADNISLDSISLSGNVGSNTAWLVTTGDSTSIVAVPTSPNQVDFDGSTAGTWLLWHVSHSGNLTGADIGADVDALGGCFSLSNAIEIIRTTDGDACMDRCTAFGGTISGGPYSFCVGDGVTDTIPSGSVMLESTVGDTSLWIVTNGDSTIILGVAQDPNEVDFDSRGLGACLLWHLSGVGDISGAIMNNSITSINGCYSLSNAITINRNMPDGGTISGGPFSFCVGDGMQDTIANDSIDLGGNIGSNSQWVLTNNQLDILALPTEISGINFDTIAVDTCMIWHLSFEDGLTGATVGMNAGNLSGCFSLSNSIMVTKDTDGVACGDSCDANGGEILGGPFAFCVGDGIADTIPTGMVTVSGNVGDTSRWVVTNIDADTILSIHNSPDDIDFENTGIDSCLLWHISYTGALTGAITNEPIDSLDGCFNLSNSISIARTDSGPACQANCTNVGGTLTGGPFDFCIGDGEVDTIGIADVSVTGNVGSQSVWVVTDGDGTIIQHIIGQPNSVNFDTIGVGSSLLWHLSFETDLEGAEVNGLVDGLTGCFALSDSIVINRVNSGATCGGGNNLTARYRVIFDGTWNETVHPVEYPANAHWSPIVGMTHNMSTALFQLGTTASPGIESMAEVGAVGTLSNEIDAHINAGNAALRINASSGGLIENDERDTLEFDITESHTLLSLVSMLAPSPDWFVGMSDIDLRQNGNWIESQIVQFDMLDAGSDSGTSYTSDNADTDPKENISVLTAGPLLVNNQISSMGIWRIERIDAGSNCNLEGGELKGGPFNFCVDGVMDTIPANGITLGSNTGQNSQWVVTDDKGFILDLPTNYTDAEFDGAGVGISFVYHLSHADGIDSLEVGNNIEELEGCFSLSNGIMVIRSDSDAACQSAIIVINELIPDGSLIELKNIGNASQDISSYFLCNRPAYESIGNMDIECGGDYILEPGETLTVEALSGTIPVPFDGMDGEMGLYLNTQYTNPNSIIDYVEWGESNHPRSTVAVDAGIWTAGAFVPAFAADMSLSYDGEGEAASDWEVTDASPCDETNLQQGPESRLSLTVMENPVMDMMHVRLQSVDRIDELTVDIRDIYGRLVKTKKMQMTGIEMYHDIEVNDLGHGIYFVSIRESYGFIQAKVVIQ